MKAIKTNLIIKQIENKKENVSASGIILTQNTETTYGEIVELGADCVKDLAVGQRIVLNWSVAIQVKHEGETYFVINQDNILAIV